MISHPQADDTEKYTKKKYNVSASVCQHPLSLQSFALLILWLELFKIEHCEEVFQHHCGRFILITSHYMKMKPLGQLYHDVPHSEHSRSEHLKAELKINIYSKDEPRNPSETRVKTAEQEIFTISTINLVNRETILNLPFTSQNHKTCQLRRRLKTPSARQGNDAQIIYDARYK